MGKILNQEEINALLRKSQEQRDSNNLGPKVEPFQFNNAGLVTRDQLSRISNLHDNFARALASDLSALLRVSIAAKLVSAEQLSFDEFVQRIAEHTYPAAIDLQPMHSQAVVQLDAHLVSAFIDVSLGGTGRDDCTLHAVTEIEDSILAGIMRLFCRDLEQAWEQVALQFRFLGRQSLGQIAAAMPETEKTLALSFEITIAEGRGTLAIAIPSTVSQMLFRPWTKKSFRRTQIAEFTAQLCHNLRSANVSLALSLPKTKLPALRLAQLQTGDILELGRAGADLPQLASGEFLLWSANAARAGHHKAGKLVQVHVAKVNQERLCHR